MNITDETNDERLATINLFSRLSSRYFLTIFNSFFDILYRCVYSDIAFFFNSILWSYDRWKTKMLNVFLSNTSRNSWYSNDNTFFITMFDMLCFLKCFFTSFRMTKNRFTFFFLLIILNVDAFIIAMFITRIDFFSFELEILSSLRFESVISNRLRVFESIDELRCFFVFSRKINCFWSIWTSFRKRTFVMIVKNFFESCFVDLTSIRLKSNSWKRANVSLAMNQIISIEIAQSSENLKWSRWTWKWRQKTRKKSNLR